MKHSNPTSNNSKRDPKHSNVNSNHSKGIRNIQIKIWFERDLKHSNGYSNHLKGIRSIWMQILITRTKFKAFDCKFVNPSNEIRSIQMQISTLKMDSNNSDANSNHSNRIRGIQMQILTIWKRFDKFETFKFKF